VHSVMTDGIIYYRHMRELRILCFWFLSFVGFIINVYRIQLLYVYIIFALWQALYPISHTDLVWINRMHNKWMNVLFLVIRYFNHSQCTKRMIPKLYLCVMCMHEYYLCSTELLICWPFRLYIYIMRKYWATGITQPPTPTVKSFHKRILSSFKMRPWVLNSHHVLT
jgi:hypothetical protein